MANGTAMSWLRFNFDKIQNDPGFRTATPEQRGVWVSLYMAAAGNPESPGRLLRRGKPMPMAMIAGLTGLGAESAEKVIEELVTVLGLVERDENGVLYFPSIIEEADYAESKRAEKIEAGRRGGQSRHARATSSTAQAEPEQCLGGELGKVGRDDSTTRAMLKQNQATNTTNNTNQQHQPTNTTNTTNPVSVGGGGDGGDKSVLAAIRRAKINEPMASRLAARHRLTPEVVDELAEQAKGNTGLLVSWLETEGPRRVADNERKAEAARQEQEMKRQAEVEVQQTEATLSKATAAEIAGALDVLEASPLFGTPDQWRVARAGRWKEKPLCRWAVAKVIRDLNDAANEQSEAAAPILARGHHREGVRAGAGVGGVGSTGPSPALALSS